MKQYKFQVRTKQAGVTLLELTVVLIILMALAGLMVPAFDRAIVTSTQDSTGVSSLAEMDKWMQVYNTKFMKEPNNMEALINGVAATSTTDTYCNTTNADVNTVYCKMICTSCFAPLSLSPVNFASLNMAGITSLYYNDPNTTDATFASTISIPVTPTTLSIGTSPSVVAQVAKPLTWVGGAGATIEDYLASVFGSTSQKFDSNCYDYVAFGIGNQSSLTGSVMSTAPVYFSDQPSSGQVVKYNRFIAVYQVDKITTPSLPSAAPLPLGGVRKGCSSGIEAAKFMGSVITDASTNGKLIGLANTQLRSAENTAYGN